MNQQMSTVTTRTTIIREFLKLVREKHFSAITVNEICKKSSISRRTFYRYYTDKQALLKDVYLECFFSKIEITENDDFWNIFAKICEQIYSDKKFFKHAFEVKGQNGFWEEASNILTPYFVCEAPSYDFLDEMKAYFVATDLNRMFHLIEGWIASGMHQNAKEFSSFIRTNYYIYGKWTCQLASKQERSTFTKEIFTDLDDYLRDNK